MVPVPAPKLVGGASHGGSLVAGVARPGSVSVSQRSWSVVLMAIVPLPNMNTPNGSRALKSVSTVITPQNSTLAGGVEHEPSGRRADRCRGR